MNTIQRIMLALALITSAPATLAGDELQKGLRAIEERNYPDAARLLKPLADHGDAIAQLEMGNLLYNGRGIKEDERAAVTFFTKSAEQGNKEAMFQLGNAFTFGSETPRIVTDADAEAAKWYFKAASSGHGEAAYSLGLLFLAGKGVQKNEKEALSWMQKAANAGHKDAQSFVQGSHQKH